MHGGGEFGGKGVEEEKVLLVSSHENTQVSDSACKESKMVIIYIFRHLLELIVQSMTIFVGNFWQMKIGSFYLYSPAIWHKVAMETIMVPVFIVWL